MWITRVMALTGALLIAGAALADETLEQTFEDLPRYVPMAYMTAHEAANPDLYYPRASERYVPPPSYGAPPPPGVVRPGEFDEMDSTIITVRAVPPPIPFYAMWTDMVEVFTQTAHTWIIATGAARENLQMRLDTAGVDPDAYSWLNYPTDAIWIRDYGPEFVVEEDGTRHIVDAAYFRPADDVIPTWIANSDWIESDGSPLEVHSHDHGINGGNIMTDGAKTCFFSNIIYGYEKPGGWTDEDVDDLMIEYYGCDQIVSLNSICLDGTGHIDLYAKFLSSTAILLGEFPPDTHFDGETQNTDSSIHCNEDYPDDHQDQEDNLAIIEAVTNLDSEPFVVTRLPMLEPFHDGFSWVYRSYMNSEIIHDHVAMPSYYDVEEPDPDAQYLLDMEAAAIAAHEAALPGVIVTPIDSDHIIPMAGAIHCIAHEIPIEAGGAWEAPAEYCGDNAINLEEECDGDEFGGETCESQGAGAGELLCDEFCQIDTSDCGGDTDTGSDSDSDTDSDADTDTDADAGTGGGGDDDCGCEAVGAQRPDNLLELVLNTI